MTTRACVSCGVLEERKRNAHGRDVTNLNPITGECLACLVRKVKQAVKPMRAAKTLVFDPRARAARNDA